MAAPPFKVKALFDYASPHEDDLSFPLNQIITVTEEEDADWYVGEYADASGETKSGLFPKNFVERYEPAPPPRPVRAARPKPAEAPPTPLPAPAETKAESTATNPEEEEEDYNAAPIAAKPAPPPEAQEPPPAPKPTPAEPLAIPSTKKSPPPVAAKSTSFRDRIAAFNKPAAAPIAPIKPPGGANTFIRKPFVAPPPSRDAYIPPPREAAPQKVYRREEDPEIAERRRQDQEDAEKAGLAPTAGDDGEEEAPKAISLKERIALLQKQQAEQAARRSGHTTQETAEKPKRPSKPRTESQEPGEGANAEAAEGADAHGEDAASDDDEAAAAPRPPRVPKVPEAASADRAQISENDADHSAVGESTEDAEGDDTSVDEPRQRHPAAPTKQPDVGDEEGGVDEEDEEEEEELDEEARHQMALRERMAKLSGGMGMPGMFGPPGAMPMPGIGGAVRKKKPAAEAQAAEEDDVSAVTAPRVPMVPIPGMGRSLPPAPTVGKESTDHPITGQRRPEEVADVEDIVSKAPARSQAAGRAVPPPPPAGREEQPTARAVPPVPSGRPSLDTPQARPVAPPPPPAAADIDSPSTGSESDDEMPAGALDQQPLPVRGAPPPVPTRDRPQTPTQDNRDDESRFTAVTASPPGGRAVPPLPSSPPSQTRAVPPLPPPGRTSTSDSLHRRVVGSALAAEGESEYEGDYDTDIASGEPHKDALKAHARESSLDESAAEDRPTATSSHPLPPPPAPSVSAPRVPPPPPSQPPTSRQSADLPRPPPPPVPQRQDDGDEYDPYRDYDPYKYTQAMASPSDERPPAPKSAPQAPPPPPARPVDSDEESGPEEEEGMQRSTTLRKSMDRPPPPLPPQAPPHDRSVAPPRPAGSTTAPSASGISSLPRRSTDLDRTLAAAGRRSIDQPRQSIDHGFIAEDVDLGEGSRWWTQPETPPPVFQNRKDVLIEFDPESTSTKRGGKTTVSKDVYVLFQDYSQTIVSVRFDAKNVDDVHLEQRHESPPNRLRQDQLEAAHAQFGAKIAEEANSKQNSAVGDGGAATLILELLRPHNTALAPVGTRAYGALVYANLANATVQQFDEIRAGDIVTFRNAKFQGKHGAMHAKYSLEVGKPDHVGVVADWDGTKKKIRAWEQGREKGKVKAEGFKLSDLRSGEVRVWRVMPRSWVGWESES